VIVLPATYEPINTTTLGSNQADVTFSSIPSTYTDLVIVANGKTTSETTLRLRFNSDSGTNYSATYMYGNGTTATSGRFTTRDDMAFYNWFSTSDGTAFFHIQNYSNTTTNKTVLARIGAAGLQTSAGVGLWRSNAAIESVTIRSGDNFSSGAVFAIYGIKAA
jgi:hypothetical protein